LWHTERVGHLENKQNWIIIKKNHRYDIREELTDAVLVDVHWKGDHITSTIGEDIHNFDRLHSPKCDCCSYDEQTSGKLHLTEYNTPYHKNF
jgi:hypothetical protein